MKIIRILDFIFALFGLLLVMPLLVTLYIIGFFGTGLPMFIQERMGRNKQPFVLVKFETNENWYNFSCSHLTSAN